MKYLHLVLRNLTRNRRRSILTALSIAVSLFLFCALMTLPRDLDLVMKSSDASLRLVCHSKAGLSYSLPESYQTRIAALAHVEAVDSWNWFGGIYHEPSDQFPNIAVDQDQVEKVWTDWSLEPGYREAFKRERIGCIVGASTMQRFHFHIGQQIMLRGTAYPTQIQLKIVGVFGGQTMPPMLLFHRDYMQERVGHTNMVDLYWVKVESSESIPLVIEEIDKTFANSSHETATESESTFQASFIESIRPLVELTKVLAAIVLLVVTMVAANTAAISVRERSTEVAVMRSLGFGRVRIMAMLQAEFAVIGAVGGMLGVGAGYLAVQALALGTSAFGLASVISMPPVVALQGLVLAPFVGLISSLIPAYTAASRTIVDGLRHVG